MHIVYTHSTLHFLQRYICAKNWNADKSVAPTLAPFYTLCLKSIPDIFSYNSRKHCRIFMIFGRNINKQASNQKLLYFSTSPN